MVKNWFTVEELQDWLDSSWDFAKKVLPLLFIDMFVAGIFMGRPGINAGLLPSQKYLLVWILLKCCWK